MYSVFININKPTVPQIWTTISSLFAKSSLVWPAILNLILFNKERKTPKKSDLRKSLKIQTYKISRNETH
jgi:hypothetical protein